MRLRPLDINWYRLVRLKKLFMKCAFTSLVFAFILAVPTDSIVAQGNIARRDSEETGGTSFKQLEGAWVTVKIVSAGKPVPEEGFLHEYHFKSPDRLLRKGITVGKVTGRDREEEIVLDDSKKPAHMNMTRTVRGNKQTVFAIYKVEDDLLTIAFLRGTDGQPLMERPRGFESDEETKADLLVLKRKAELDE